MKRRRPLKELVLSKLTPHETAELVVDTLRSALPPHLRDSKREFAAETFREIADLIEEL